jgi:uncharacterized protein YecT (DUF1311 family)
MRRRSRIAMLTFAVAVAGYSVAGQTPSGPPPSKAVLEKERQDFLAQLATFKKSGRAGYSDEMTREKAGDCPNAASTQETVTCLKQEIEKTAANYTTYFNALRSVEGLGNTGETNAGATGSQSPYAEERVEEFDDVETAWQTYRKAQCSAAYDAYRGGTIAPIMGLTCQLSLMRGRTRELENIYQFMH